jgi:hypothetical protein
MAQEKPASALAALRETAQQKAAEWDALAQDLETRTSHLLPCDPRVSGAIEEASRASEARLAALRQYLETDQARANSNADAANRFIATQSRLKGELNAERAEAGQERLAIEGLLVEAGESVKRRARLVEARKILENIAEMIRLRGAQTQAELTDSDALSAALADLNASLKTRQTALENERRSLDAEIPRWHEYYAARLARAQAECAVINPPAPAPRRPAGAKKQ